MSEQSSTESTSEDEGTGAAEAVTATPDESEIEEIERERETRLDPDNRPDGVEIDNTQRDFDAEKGMFTDSDGYEQAPAQYPASGEAEG